MAYLLEGCVDSLASVRAALSGGADRLELCANLPVGGTTPSPFVMREAVRMGGEVPVRVLIRPRCGDFSYDAGEVGEMEASVREAKAAGAKGVVIGALTPEGELDLPALSRLIAAADGLSITLHRAFDLCRDPFAALEAARGLGIDTILTSGQAAGALEGADLLERLAAVSGPVTIMAGSGVSAAAIPGLWKRGIRAFHMSGKTVREGPMRFRREGLSMGLPYINEYQRMEADPLAFAEAARILAALEAND